MTDLQVKCLYLHDDDAPPIETDTTISVRNDDDALGYIRGRTIGEVVKTSNRWIPYSVDSAICTATATVRNIILQEFLKLPSFKPWEGLENMVSVVMASECIFVCVERPISSPITLTNFEVESWTDTINNAQDLFVIGKGHISSGSPQGGAIQIPYTLK